MKRPTGKGRYRTGSDGSELRLSEAIPHGDDDADDAERYDEREVGDLWGHAAVEAVVEPRHKRTHDQQRYATVVQPTHKMYRLMKRGF